MQYHTRDNQQQHKDHNARRKWPDQARLAQPVEPIGKTTDRPVFKKNAGRAAITHQPRQRHRQ